MKIFLTLFTLLLCFVSNAQQQSFDLFSFNAPQKWNSATKSNGLIFSTTDQKAKTWGQIDLVKSTTSKGSIEEDFKSEWKELVMNRYGVTGQPIGIDSQDFQGYKVWTALGKFLVKNDTASVLLNTFSDGKRCASFILLSNTKNYGPVFDEFIASINLVKPTSTTFTSTTSTPTTTSTQNNTGFQFNTTNFDDGWTSVVKEDWVEATKGKIKVLLHYPREEDKKYYPQYKEHVSTFWNLLVAPRYSNLRNYESPDHLLSWQPGLFAAGLLRDNVTGNDVWVALFSKGTSGWMEVISPDKKTFVDNFGVDKPELYFDGWDKMLPLFGLNKFAVGENDLVGTWSNQFYGATAYYNVNTGLYAGSSSVASGVNYSFKANKTYQWNLGMTSSNPGTTAKTDVAKANGTWKVLNNWQIWCSDIERKPVTYNAYFTCIKGARVLWLQDVSYGSYTAYGKINN